jgi:4-hydroxy 2-oxovalerate aldolase
MAGREVLILATGPGVAAHRPALEAYIQRARPLVIALNTQSAINPSLINLRIACHPVRLLADAEAHASLPQPLITPASMLPETILSELGDKDLLDFGIGISPGCFEFHESHCIAPTSLVLAYSLAVATSGQAARILMAGFDGYAAGDLRNDEINKLFEIFCATDQSPDCFSITPSRFRVNAFSVYAL